MIIIYIAIGIFHTQRKTLLYTDRKKNMKKSYVLW